VEQIFQPVLCVWGSPYEGGDDEEDDADGFVDWDEPFVDITSTTRSGSCQLNMYNNYQLQQMHMQHLLNIKCAAKL
jgi:hypothetical protein